MIENFMVLVQKVIPNVYDDALSYHEGLGKVVMYLNQVIDQINLQKDYLETGVNDAIAHIETNSLELINLKMLEVNDAIAQIETNAIESINLKMLEVNDALETINDKVSQSQLDTVNAQLEDYEILLSKGTVMPLTLQNNWTGTLSYRKYGNGIVRVWGQIKNGDLGNAIAIATLPEDYRPPTTVSGDVVLWENPFSVHTGGLIQGSGDILVRSPAKDLIDGKTIRVHFMYMTN